MFQHYYVLSTGWGHMQVYYIASRVCRVMINQSAEPLIYSIYSCSEWVQAMYLSRLYRFGQVFRRVKGTFAHSAFFGNCEFDCEVPG